MATSTRQTGGGFSGDLEGYVYDELKRGNSVVVEAYPGFGKTRLGARMLSAFERAVMAVRTHEEMSEVFGFLGSSKGVAYAYGKPKLCYRLDDFEYGYCRAMLSVGRCRPTPSNRDVAWVAATFRRPEDVREEAKRRNRCLYFAMRVLAQSHGKLVTTYDYLASNPSALKKKDVAILDEAQTLLDYVDEVVVAVDGTFVEYTARALKSDESTRFAAYALRVAYRRSAGIHDFVEKLETVLSGVGPVQSPVASLAVETLESIVESYRRRWYSSDGRVHYFMSSTLPSLARFEPKLLLGAYLPPPFLAAKNVVRVHGGARVEMVIDGDLTSQYETRGEDVYAGYARKIAEYARSDVGNLAVFPSRAFMEEVLSRVGDDVRSRVLREPVGDSVPSGKVLVDVAGGSYTEGVNIRNLGCVIVCGMPYPEPNPVLSLVSRAYGCDMYAYIALSRTLQAVGRMRGGGVAYAIDRRFRNHMSKVPPWVNLRTA